MEREVRSQWAVHGGIAFYSAIEQLYSKGQQTVSFIVAKPKTLQLCYLENVITNHSTGQEPITPALVQSTGIKALFDAQVAIYGHLMVVPFVPLVASSI